jgi:tetratricopeptide (TPR) repeat protein
MRVIDNILKKTAIDPEVMSLKGEELCRQGYYLDAIDVLDKVIAAEPRHARSSYLKGYALYQIGSFEEALQYFDQALGIDPNHPDALVYKGLIYSSFGKHGKALALYERALILHPTLIQAWYAMGLTLAILQKYEEALLAYEQVLYLDPRHVDALIGISVARKKRGNICQNKSPSLIPVKEKIQNQSNHGSPTCSTISTDNVRRSQSPTLLEPSQPKVVNPAVNVPGSAIAHGQPVPEPLSQTAKPSVSPLPESIRSTVNISGSPGIKEELDRTKQVFSDSNKTDSTKLHQKKPPLPTVSTRKSAEKDKPEYIVAVAPTSDSPGYSSYDEKIRNIEENLSDEMDPDQLKNLGSLYMKTGRYKDATKAFERILEIERENAHSWQSLGDARKKSGIYDEALFAYEKSLEIDPENAVLWVHRAKVLVMMKRHDEAIASCNKAIALDDISLDAWLYKGFILKKIQRSSDAIATYNRILELNPGHDHAVRQLKNIKGGA